MLAQRRRAERDDVEAVEEVLTEASAADLLLEIPVGRGDDANVDARSLLRADRLDVAALEDAQHLGLRPRREVADLVEEDRAAVGGDELADLLAHRAGEAPLLVAEELRLDQLFGDRRAVDADEWLVAPRRAVVDGARHELLAGAALARDQHRGGSRRRALDRLAQAAHGRRASHQRLHAALRDGAPLLAGVPTQAPGFDRVAQREQNPVALERFLEEVEGAAAGRFDRGRHVGVAADHQHRHVVAALAQLPQGLEPVHLRHPEVEQHRVRRAVAHDTQGFDARGRLLDAVALELEGHAEAVANRGLVVDDQDRGARGRGHGAKSSNRPRIERGPAPRGTGPPDSAG